MEDTLDMDEDDELEEEADAEVDKVLFALTNGKLGEAGEVSNVVPVCHLSSPMLVPRAHPLFQTTDTTLEDEETEKTMEKYRQTLSGILS